MTKYILISFVPSKESYARSCLVSSSKEEQSMDSYEDKDQLFLNAANCKYNGRYITIISPSCFIEDSYYCDLETDNIPNDLSDFYDYYRQYEKDRKATEEALKKDKILREMEKYRLRKELEEKAELRKLKAKYPYV